MFKKILFSLLAVLAPLFVQAEEIENFPRIATDAWRVSDSELVLDIDLGDQLVFKKSYRVDTIKDGQGWIQIFCVPLKNTPFHIKEGIPLKEISLRIDLSSDPSNHKVTYRVFETLLFEETGWFTTKTTTINRTRNEVVSDLEVDISGTPGFFLYADTDSQGYISFPIAQ